MNVLRHLPTISMLLLLALPSYSHAATDEGKGWYQLVVEGHKRNVTASLLASRLNIAQIDAVKHVSRFRQILSSPENKRLPREKRVDSAIDQLRGEIALYPVAQSNNGRLNTGPMYKVVPAQKPVVTKPVATKPVIAAVPAVARQSVAPQPISTKPAPKPALTKKPVYTTVKPQAAKPAMENVGPLYPVQQVAVVKPQFKQPARPITPTPTRPAVKQPARPITPTPVVQKAQMPPLWHIEPGTNPQGSFHWKTNEICKAVEVDETPLRVSDYYSAEGESDFENLRSTGEFISTGGNIKSLLPQNSLVYMKDQETTDYIRIRVISRARYAYQDYLARKAQGGASTSISKINEEGFIFKTSLEDLRKYSIDLGSNRFVNRTKRTALPLENAILQVSQTAQGRMNGIHCCIGKVCENFLIFDILNPDEKKDSTPRSNQVAISPRMSEILQSATAQLVEADGIFVDEDGQAIHQNEPSESEAEATEQATESDTPEKTEADKTAEDEVLKTLALPDTAPAPQSRPDPEAIAGLDSSGTSPEKVICLDYGTVSVRGEPLSKVLFKAESGEEVLIRQGFDGSRKKFKDSTGTEHTMVQAQFPKRDGDPLGWVAEQFVKTESQCDEKKKASASGDEEGSDAAGISGAIFPLSKRPVASYRKSSGHARWFGAGRSGRKHAACDLFTDQGAPARAITPGKVIQGPYHFYGLSYAVEVKHSDGRVVRYGEISKTRARGIKNGATLKKGQIVGTVQRVSRRSHPMLHFEMYSGTGRGGLTVRGGQFKRRRDLIDPTSALRAMEKATFGKSW